MPYVLIKLLLLAHMFGGIAVWHHADDPSHVWMTTQHCDWSYSVSGPTGFDICTTHGY